MPVIDTMPTGSGTTILRVCELRTVNCVHHVRDSGKLKKIGGMAELCLAVAPLNFVGYLVRNGYTFN